MLFLMRKQEHEAQYHTILDNKSFTGIHKKRNIV